MSSVSNPMDFAAGVEAVRAFVRREQGRREAATAGRTATLRGLVAPLATALHEAGATAIWVFGSLARTRGWSAPHPDSDLDVAVEGLDAARFFEVERALRAVISEPFDLLRIEDAPASLRERIERDGERIA